MLNDIRYSEFQFLSALEQRSRLFEYFNPSDPKQQELVGLNNTFYTEMVITLAEELHVRFEDDTLQILVARLRGDVSQTHPLPTYMAAHHWNNPREALHHLLIPGQQVRSLKITYRGLRRIQELRDLLKRDRILEPLGVLLSMQYFHRDLEDALGRPTDLSVSVLHIDMDNFGIINKMEGYAAGDVVMKAYLEVVHRVVGNFGAGYRGTGDEVRVLIPGQGHQRASEFAEAIRKEVEALRCEFKEKKLPLVTASIGVATTPPEARALELQNLADSRQLQAKKGGKNRVVSA